MPNKFEGSNNLPKEEQNELESESTINYILSGKAEVKLIPGKPFSQTRRFYGEDWPGQSAQFEIILPKVSGEGKWITYLTVWNPSPLNYGRFKKVPETKNFINTGHGEMLLTENQDTIYQVVNQLDRQTREKD